MEAEFGWGEWEEAERPRVVQGPLPSVLSAPRIAALQGLVPRMKPVPWEGRELERAETHDAPKGFPSTWSHGPWTW